MNALPVVITSLVLQILSADCAVCKIGNDVRVSNPALSVWSRHTGSPTHCTKIELGGVTVHSKSPEILEQQLLVQLSNVYFTSKNGYICQTLKRMLTGLLSSDSIANPNEFTQSTIKPPPKEASTFTIPPSSSPFTSSVPTKHSSLTMPSTKSLFSSKGSTKSPSVTSSLSTVRTSTATQSPSKQPDISTMLTQYSRLTIPSTTSSLSSESTPTSSFSTSSLSQVVSSDATETSSKLVSSTMSTPTNNPVMSSAAEANDGLPPSQVPCPHRYEVTGKGVNCYQLIFDQVMFTNASKYCKDIQPNAHLVTFENQSEEEWVVHLINNMTNASGHDYWIGLKNAAYTWEDGSYLSYANFGDKYTDHGGECLYMDVSRDSIWKGGRCTDNKKILCEYELTENTSSCSMKYDNSCYFATETRSEKAEGSQICKDNGKYFVQIETAGEQAYLNNVLTEDVWIGLLKNESATYVWENKNNTAAEYVNFGDENNVDPLPHGGICHRIKQNDSYSWNEERCDTEHSFICEWSLN